MFRWVKFLSEPARLAALVIVAAAGVTVPEARAQDCCAGDPPDDVSFFAFLFEGDPHSLDFSNSNVFGASGTPGNIGIGNTGAFSGSGSGTITGAVEFSAMNMGQFSPGGISVNGGATFGNANVSADLAALAGISAGLSGEAGTSLTIAGGGSVLASTGTPDHTTPHNNLVFNAVVGTSFVAGTTFTIIGDGSSPPDQYVVINIPSSVFDGSIVLAGGLTPDHVLFNFTSSDPSINTDGNTTTGIFLDPFGAIDITDSVIDGRIFGGDTADASISDSTIVSPVPFETPEPTSLALLAAGLGVFGIIRRRHRRLTLP